MNRFRSRKKAKEALDGRAGPDVPPVPSLTPKVFKKSKKPQIEEQKAEVDISTALPSSDDLRTSLLMPNLSARFSMLREQDDPGSKIGKANDDSVLFPKRASRLNLFGNSQLGDIAEVSSIANSARPSLAIGRGSFASGEGYGTDDDHSQSGNSIMNRRRQGEGNNLFGGRQKVYKIPVKASQKNDSSAQVTSPGGNNNASGQVTQEEDATQTALQKLNQREGERRQQLTLETEYLQDSKNIDTDEAPSSPASRPSIARASTSATSLESQSRISATNPGSAANSTASSIKPSPVAPGIERNLTKSKRLYGQGLEPQNQQPSAITRLESLSRQRAAANDPSAINRSLSRSAGNLNEKYQRKSPVYASSNFRPNSPPPSATTSIMENIGPTSKDNGTESIASNQSLGFAPPLSPPASETEEAATFAASVQPEDRGKATAMGLFNKPATKYDEQQFTQRQLQMFEGRNTPPLRRPSPKRIPSTADSTRRSRGLSSTSGLSKADSSVSHPSVSHDITNRVEDLSAPSSTGNLSPAPQTNGTFFVDLEEASDDGGDEASENINSSNVSQTFDGVHPAFRASVDSNNSPMAHAATTSDNNISVSNTPELRYSEPRDLNTIEENQAAETPSSPVVDKASDRTPDSPTLGPGLGLSGLVDAHLRRTSRASSIYPLPPESSPPRLLGTTYCPRSSAQAPASTNFEGSIHSNPWEYDDLIESSPPDDDGDEEPANANISNMSLRAKQMLGQATALSSQGYDKDSEQTSESFESQLQEELKYGHHRGASSETQLEREELAHEMAERRRKVQEKLKNFAEGDSRPASPTLGHHFTENGSPGRSGNAFAMLRNRTGKTPMLGKLDASQSKSMKLLGMESPSESSSSPHFSTNGQWREEESRKIREYTSESRSHSPHVRSRQNSRSRQIGHQSPPRSANDERPPSSQYAFSSRETQRSRAGSDASVGSRGVAKHRDDLGPVGEQPESSYEGTWFEEQNSRKVSSSVASSARPSVETHDIPRHGSPVPPASGRFRSDSKPSAPSYFDNQHGPSIQTNQADFIGVSPRPSPMTPYSANATPPLCETSPAPSGATTPNHVPTSNQSNSQRSQSLGSHRRPVDKSLISEPKFVSTTSNVPTIGLPPGASLSNGATPPVPPMNPRRKRTTTRETILGALKGLDRHESQPPLPSVAGSGSDEKSMFSDDDKRHKSRHRLRKISSEGGNLNSKARHLNLLGGNSSTFPQLPKHPPPPPPSQPQPQQQQHPPQPSTVEGGMI